MTELKRREFMLSLLAAQLSVVLDVNAEDKGKAEKGKAEKGKTEKDKTDKGKADKGAADKSGDKGKEPRASRFDTSNLEWRTSRIGNESVIEWSPSRSSASRFIDRSGRNEIAGEGRYIGNNGRQPNNLSTRERTATGSIEGREFVNESHSIPLQTIDQCLGLSNVYSSEIENRTSSIYSTIPSGVTTIYFGSYLSGIASLTSSGEGRVIGAGYFFNFAGQFGSYKTPGFGSGGNVAADIISLGVSSNFSGKSYNVNNPIPVPKRFLPKNMGLSMSTSFRDPDFSEFTGISISLSLGPWGVSFTETCTEVQVDDSLYRGYIDFLNWIGDPRM